MPLKAINQLRQNIETLLRKRHEDQKTLAFFLNRHPSTINKFLKGTRELQLADLDRIADFFGLATYQLFQPGISPLSERRLLRDRRGGRDRRIGHQHRELLDVGRGHGTAAHQSITDELRRITAEHERRVSQLLSQAQPGGQTTAPSGTLARPRRRRRIVGGSNIEKP